MRFELKGQNKHISCNRPSSFSVPSDPFGRDAQNATNSYPLKCSQWFFRLTEREFNVRLVMHQGNLCAYYVFATSGPLAPARWPQTNRSRGECVISRAPTHSFHHSTHDDDNSFPILLAFFSVFFGLRSRVIRFALVHDVAKLLIVSVALEGR